MILKFVSWIYQLHSLVDIWVCSKSIKNNRMTHFGSAYDFVMVFTYSMKDKSVENVYLKFYNILIILNYGWSLKC